MSIVMKIVTFTENDYSKHKIPEGTILRLLSSDFNTETQQTVFVFELIGNPVSETDLHKVEFKYESN